jgi:hypothetical protein
LPVVCNRTKRLALVKCQLKERNTWPDDPAVLHTQKEQPSRPSLNTVNMFC